MRTNIDIDDDLLESAMKALGTHTKKSTVEAALELAIRRHTLRGLLELPGAVEWEGDLLDWRRDRPRQSDWRLAPAEPTPAEPAAGDSTPGESSGKSSADQPPNPGRRS